MTSAYISVDEHGRRTLIAATEEVEVLPVDSEKRIDVPKFPRLDSDAVELL